LKSVWWATAKVYIVSGHPRSSYYKWVGDMCAVRVGIEIECFHPFENSTGGLPTSLVLLAAAWGVSSRQSYFVDLIVSFVL
jgi:hypothetical protein